MKLPWPESSLATILGAISLLGDREEQQDRYLISYQKGALFLLVADGLGGHSGGAEASSILAATAEKMFLKKPLAPAESLFPDILTASWEKMRLAEAKTGRELRSTAVMIRLRGQGRAEWAHAGDSRLYVLGPDGGLRHRTKDQTIAELSVFNGEMTEEEARHHPDRSVMYNCVGGEKPPKTALGRVETPLEDGSLIILCSDGFWEHIYPEKLTGYQEGADISRLLAEKAQEAVNLAAGDADNATALAFKYHRALFPENQVRRFWSIFKR
ncbi:serine/threonine phosphatase [Deltaproteobacteria bacterium]|nr:serine/threonine phosphatase [Deltaproteobacteria bacterium]